MRATQCCVCHQAGEITAWLIAFSLDSDYVPRIFHPEFMYLNFRRHMRLPGLKLNITRTSNKDGRMLAAKNNFVSSWVVGDVVTFTNASVVTRANDLHSTRATTKTMNGKFHARRESTSPPPQCLTFAFLPTGGACWLNLTTRSGMCTALFDGMSTFEECCGEHGPGMGYTEGDFDRGDIFRMSFLETSSKCQPCMRTEHSHSNLMSCPQYFKYFLF